MDFNKKVFIMKNINKILLIIGSICAIIYIILDNIIGNFPLNFLLKAFPIWCIAYYVFNKNNYWIGMGLLFGSLGDIFLTNSEELFFILGLASFLVGHIFYIIYFVKNFKFQYLGIWIMILILCFSGILSGILIPNLPQDLIIPVSIYIIVISFMAISTGFYQYFNYYSFLGAILFLISDTMIAINKFLFPIQFSNIFIMVSYYMAQSGIGYGSIYKKPS